MRTMVSLVVLALDLQLFLFFIYLLIDWIITTKKWYKSIQRWIERRLYNDTNN